MPAKAGIATLRHANEGWPPAPTPHSSPGPRATAADANRRWHDDAATARARHAPSRTRRPSRERARRAVRHQARNLITQGTAQAPLVHTTADK